MGIGPIVAQSRAIFFDRDGVLCRAIVRDGRPYPPRKIGELTLEDGAQSALARLAPVVPLLFVVTNQPDVARGTLSREIAEELNAELLKRLPITRIYTCYHDDSDGCSCRKPLPGALLEAADEYGVDLRASFMLGDRWRDIEAGAAAGCTTVLIQKDYAERRPRCEPDIVVRSITEAVDCILDRLALQATSIH
jgi:D-glycero-D-manno-heptose 1,7-bisphosphate phosphatase